MKVFNKKRSLLFYLITVSLSVCSLQNECFAAGRQRFLTKTIQQPQPATATAPNLPIVAGDKEQQQQIHIRDDRDELEGIIQAVIQRNNRNTQQLIQQINNNILHIPEDILKREQFLKEMERRQTAFSELKGNLQAIANGLNDIRTRLAALENANNQVRTLTNTEDNGYHNFTTTGVVVGGTVIAGIGAAAGYVLCRFFRGR